MHEIVSIHDLHIGNKKIELKPFNAKTQKVGMLFGDKFISHLSNSVMCLASKHLANLDDVTVTASYRISENIFDMQE